VARKYLSPTGWRNLKGIEALPTVTPGPRPSSSPPHAPAVVPNAVDKVAALRKKFDTRFWPPPESYVHSRSRHVYTCPFEFIALGDIELIFTCQTNCFEELVCFGDILLQDIVSTVSIPISLHVK